MAPTPKETELREQGFNRGVLLHGDNKSEPVSSYAERELLQQREQSFVEPEELYYQDEDKDFMPPPQEGDMVINKSGGMQSHVDARMDLIPPLNLLLLGECLGFGAKKYAENNWHNISENENLNHALVHILKWLEGDRSEPHLVNTLARVNFALYHAINSGEQPTKYIHPDMVKQDGESNS